MFKFGRPRNLLCALVVGCALSPASATPFIGSASNFGVLGLAGGEVEINSSTSIIGNVGYSANVTSNTNQKVDSFTGTAYVHSTASFNHTAATFSPSGGIIVGGAADTLLDQANVDALNAAAAITALTPTHAALGVVSDGDNISLTSVGGLNVIEIASLKHKEDTISLTGGAGDVFVFNVAGDFDYDNSQIILNGILADNVIFNFTSATADIRIGKAGTAFSGTILAVDGTVDYHNPATFNGRIIANDITLHSDFNIESSNSVTQISEPAVPAIILLGFLLFRLHVRKHRGVRNPA